MRYLELLEAQETIRRLEQQLRQLQEAKQALEHKERELGELMRQLQSEREMGQEERERLVAEIALREGEVSTMRTQVLERDGLSNALHRHCRYPKRRQKLINYNAKLKMLVDVSKKRAKR